MTKTFFSEKRANTFAETLRNQGFETVQVWFDKDGFNQNIYIVKWF